MAKPRLLDLFCGAGGAAHGYHRAGFEVVGVDIAPQPNYPFEFVQADARDVFYYAYFPDPWTFDAIHASPPCQHDTAMQSVAQNAAAHPDLIAPTRDLLERTGLPYVIENVVGAKRKLRSPIQLCGSSFGLDHPLLDRELRRHRLFETNWPLTQLVPPCAHRRPALGIYGDHLRLGRRSSQGELSGKAALEAASDVMEIDWMTWDEIKEAIPPAYTYWIGQSLLEHLDDQSSIRLNAQDAA